jgi:hypothetical protein
MDYPAHRSLLSQQSYNYLIHYTIYPPDPTINYNKNHSGISCHHNNHSGIIHRSSWVIIVTIDHCFSHRFSQRFARERLRNFWRFQRFQVLSATVCAGAMAPKAGSVCDFPTERWIGRQAGWRGGWRAWGPLGDLCFLKEKWDSVR